jgi:hypothetical protein
MFILIYGHLFSLPLPAVLSLDSAKILWLSYLLELLLVPNLTLDASRRRTRALLAAKQHQQQQQFA